MNPAAGRLDVYFALSHSRSSAPNKWVQRFHQSLENEVQARAEPTAALRVGSLYFPTEAAAREAMSSATTPDARVLVPLYTREFLHSPPPDYTRFRDSGESRRPHVHPVLWDAYPGVHDVNGLAQARSLGAEIPEYKDVGLAAMCRLNAYAPLFKQLVERLAERIVATAEHPDREPPWAGTEITARGGHVAETKFIISVIAPEGVAWNPYGPQLLRGTLAEYAEGVAKRLRLLPETVDYASTAATTNGVLDSPGVLLIDPWALRQEETRTAVEHALSHPPPWVTILLVTDRLHIGDEATLRGLLGRATDIAGGVLTIVHDVDEFQQEIEDVVLRTRRRYLRRHPINPNRDTVRGTDEGDRQ